MRIAFQEPFYVGIGVCSHNKDVTEKAVFSNVELTHRCPPPPGRAGPLQHARDAGDRLDRSPRRPRHARRRIEAPNWLRDGQTLIFNSGGRIYRIPAAGGQAARPSTPASPRAATTTTASRPTARCWPSATSRRGSGSRSSTRCRSPAGRPGSSRRPGPSYWHGWSPDGKTLAYCGERDGEFDIYTIPAEGGHETRLTTAKGLDDGPEYSPDGKSIYFNSDRTGTMQIWRMKPDGSDQEQVTDDEFNNWFPHPSPDGRSMVFLSYEKDVAGHPENKDVTLRRMTLDGKKIDVLGRFFGGQGTINVPCWSPDGRKIAFVTYQLIAD